MKTHELKIWPQWFEAVAEGRKRAEYRVADRQFEVGDALWLREYVPRSLPASREAYYTGRELWVQITHVAVVDAAHALLSIELTDGAALKAPSNVDALMAAARYMSARQVQELRGRLAELASAQAARRGRR